MQRPVKEVNGASSKQTHFWIVFSYLLVAFGLIATAPTLKQLLYEPSKEWIRALAPYRRPWLNQLNHLFADLGDGDFFFFVGCMFFVLNDPVDFVYLTMCFLYSLHWGNFLKPLFHHSRPYYDDITLAETQDTGSCSIEYGNPSGHAYMAGLFIPLFLLTVRDKKF